MNLREKIQDRIFGIISEAADELQVEAYVIGGYVRDIFLKRPSKDIDVVTVGSGIALAKLVAKKLGKNVQVTVFKNFGTAQLKHEGCLLYTSPSPRDGLLSRMPSSA